MDDEISDSMLSSRNGMPFNDSPKENKMSVMSFFLIRGEINSSQKVCCGRYDGRLRINMLSTFGMIYLFHIG
jgi:hypothetical protein